MTIFLLFFLGLKMPYTFDKTKNILTINPYSGIKIRDIYNHEMAERGIEFNHSGHKFEGTLCAFDGSLMKRYEVFFSFNDNNHSIIIRVKKPYHDAKFEDIFNLGCHCQITIYAGS